MSKTDKGTILHISDNYRAVWDGQHNWVLEELTTIQAKGKNKDGEEREDWKFLGFFGNIPSLLNHLLRKVLVPNEFNGTEFELSEVIRVIEDTSHRYRKVLDEF